MHVERKYSIFNYFLKKKSCLTKKNKIFVEYRNFSNYSIEVNSKKLCGSYTYRMIYRMVYNLKFNSTSYKYIIQYDFIL